MLHKIYFLEVSMINIKMQRWHTQPQGVW